MRSLLGLAFTVVCASAAAETRSVHARLIQKFEEPNTWTNRSNFYVGARGGIAIPSGTVGLTPSAGLEIGVAPSFGFGFGLHLTWMDHPPGAPAFNIGPAQYGFGALADVRFNIPTIDVLTLYPMVSVGFLAGPSSNGTNMVLPLVNPGVGAKVKLGNFYGSLEFGLSGFTIPFLNLGFGYEGDRRKERAEAWALEQEEEAQRQGVEVDLRPKLSPPPLPAPVED